MKDETNVEKPPSFEGPFESAFDALFEPEEAANLKVRARLMTQLEAYVSERGLTQEAAAQRLGTGQPRISDLMAGRIGNFTVDALLNMCTAAGLTVEISVKSPGSAAGTVEA